MNAISKFSGHIEVDEMTKLREMVSNACTSSSTRRAYEKAINDFLDWYVSAPYVGLNRGVVRAHLAWLKEKGYSISSINIKRYAIVKFCYEAWQNGYISADQYLSIKDVKPISTRGKKLGTWLSLEQAQLMIDAPDASTALGKRDRAIIAVGIGAGLRSSEIARLKVCQLKPSSDRWVISDVYGKGYRFRSIPIALWVKRILDDWISYAELCSEDFLFPSARKGGKLNDSHIHTVTIWHICKRYSPVADVKPIDLRRTFARLSFLGGASVEQIQHSLGHTKMHTTLGYIGLEQDMKKGPSDHIAIDP